MNIGKITAAVVISLSLVSCAPRGETITLDEVLAKAKAQYSAVRGLDVPADVGTSLKDVVAKLDAYSDALQSPGGSTALSASDLSTISDSLAGIITRAGYTNRPAIGEIVAQYRALGVAQQVDAAQMKLLVARTYSILANELGTTKFQVG